MAFTINDRVRETTNTTGTSDFVLQGATAGFTSFGVGIGDGNSTYYAAADPDTGAWEVGVGTYTALTDTLSRDSVLTSSNSNALVNFAAGTKTVWCTQPASKAVFVDDNGDITATGGASIPNSLLANDSITINGVPVALGASGTFALDTLTIGSGLTGGSYNGSGPVTIALDSSAVLEPADIGVTVQAYDPTILTDSDIGVTVQPFVGGGFLSAADIGVTVQAWDAGLDDIAGLAVTDGNIIVGNGTNWVVESGATARASLGLTIGTDVQAYDADTAKTDVDQTFTGAQRGAITTDNDGSFDMNAANNFSCTPTGAFALTFTNITAGQGGIIKLVNGSNYVVTAAATTKIATTDLTTISATGTYILSYWSDGTNVYVSASGNLT